MRHIWLRSLPLLILGLPLRAENKHDDLTAACLVADQPKAEKVKTPQETYDALMKEYQDASSEYMKTYTSLRAEIQKKTSNRTEQSKLLREAVERLGLKQPDGQALAKRLYQLAEEHPSDPAAGDALATAVSMTLRGPEAEKAITRLAKDHLNNAKLVQLFRVLPFVGSEAGEKLMRDALAKSSNREVRGWACFGLAQTLKRRAETVEGIKEGKAGGLVASALLGGQSLEKLRTLDVAVVNKEKEELLDRVVKEFGDIKDIIEISGVRTIDRGTLGEQAGAELFEIRHLSLGKTPPDIEGEDTDGVPFKLSDYRGKVVVLDFWGHW